MKPSKPRRPFGVIILIILEILSILLIVVKDLDLFNVIRLDTQTLAPLLSQERVTTTLFQVFEGLNLAVIKSISTVYLISMISLAVIGFHLVLIFGLLWLRRWAWVLVMVQVGVIMVFDLWSYFNGAALYFSMVTSVVMVFYLNQREVQQAFSRREAKVEAVEV